MAHSMGRAAWLMACSVSITAVNEARMKATNRKGKASLMPASGASIPAIGRGVLVAGTPSRVMVFCDRLAIVVFFLLLRSCGMQARGGGRRKSMTRAQVAGRVLIDNGFFCLYNWEYRAGPVIKPKASGEFAAAREQRGFWFGWLGLCRSNSP